MTEEDYKAINATYQQKAFELFNQNIVLETQVNSFKAKVDLLSQENEKLKSPKTRKSKEPLDGDFT